ncbi:MAG: flagellin [Verrucomicrobiota bacterium]
MPIIGSNAGSTASLFVRNNNESLDNSIRRLSSGSRLANPLADAAGVAVSGKLDAAIQRLSASNDGARNIISFSQTSDGFLGTAQGQLTRLSELAQRATDGTLSDDARTALNTEFTAIRDQIGQTLQNASFNGTSLFQNGEISTAINDQGDTDSIQTQELNNTTLGIQSLSLDDAASALGAISTLDNALSTVTSERARVNADISRFQFHANNIDNQKINVESANSRIKDLNIAEESTNFARDSILLRASVAMVSQSNAANASVLGLLK